MFNASLKRAALAACAICIGAHAAQAAGAVTVDLQSSPVSWGTTGHNSVLVLQYDTAATRSLTISSIYIGEVNNTPLPQLLDTCGTPIKSGDSVVAYSLAPGQHCFLESPQTTSASIYGEVKMSDGTKNATSMNANVRAMIEVRDGSNAVLSHVELH